jgi:hypothetical protein
VNLIADGARIVSDFLDEFRKMNVTLGDIYDELAHCGQMLEDMRDKSDD